MSKCKDQLNMGCVKYFELARFKAKRTIQAAARACKQVGFPDLAANILRSIK